MTHPILVTGAAGRVGGVKGLQPYLDLLKPGR